MGARPEWRFEWVGKKKLKPKNVEPVVRDHRQGGGGVTVKDTATVRDHRAQPVVRDHRAGAETDGNHQPVARDKTKKKKIIGVQWPF